MCRPVVVFLVDVHQFYLMVHNLYMSGFSILAVLVTRLVSVASHQEGPQYAASVAP